MHAGRGLDLFQRRNTMGAYGRLLRYVSNVKTEIILKSLLGLMISAT